MFLILVVNDVSKIAIHLRPQGKAVPLGQSTELSPAAGFWPEYKHGRRCKVPHNLL